MPQNINKRKIDKFRTWYNLMRKIPINKRKIPPIAMGDIFDNANFYLKNLTKLMYF